jgi:hypothetical protein
VEVLEGILPFQWGQCLLEVGRVELMGAGERYWAGFLGVDGRNEEDLLEARLAEVEVLEGILPFQWGQCLLEVGRVELMGAGERYWAGFLGVDGRNEEDLLGGVGRNEEDFLGAVGRNEEDLLGAVGRNEEDLLGGGGCREGWVLTSPGNESFKCLDIVSVE